MSRKFGRAENGGHVSLGFAPVSKIDIGREHHQPATAGVFGRLGKLNSFDGTECGYVRRPQARDYQGSGRRS